MLCDTQLQGPNQIPSSWEETERRYYKRMQKRIAGKPPPVQIIMERTFNTACLVLRCIHSMPFSQLTKALYFLCKSLPHREMARQFESQLELAGANPERFVFGLHPFYNNFVAMVRREKRYGELFSFIGSVVRIRIENPSLADADVVDTYMNLLLQVTEYLRPNKLNLESFVYGISTGGELLSGPVPYSFFDVPWIQLRRSKTLGNPETAAILDMYGHQEPQIQSASSIMRLTEVLRMHTNMTAAMLPFINEFTWDIVPVRMYDSNIAPLMELTHKPFDFEVLSRSLTRRKRTLPSNGVTFKMDDPTGEVQGLLLKEILHEERVHLLYRVDFQIGSLSGYYDTSDSFFYSALKGAAGLEFAIKLEELVLAAYASQVLSPADSPDITSFFLQNGQPLRISSYARGGRLRDAYHVSPAPEGRHGSKRRQGEYWREERNINGFIRRLPTGQTASAAAVAMAAKYGYDLAPDETYVRSFIRASVLKTLVSKEKPPTE